ncbi:MAG: hypothetical protein NC548_63290, partial [Lachnospiraceae bacterium]|nr:hypothetical protein [Lachnospiraceae bacterium]
PRAVIPSVGRKTAEVGPPLQPGQFRLPSYFLMPKILTVNGNYLDILCKYLKTERQRKSPAPVGKLVAGPFLA